MRITIHGYLLMLEASPTHSWHNVFIGLISSCLNDMNEACGYQGNGDLYGLGIRVGLYIQLLTICMVSSVLPKSLHSSYFINTNISLFASTWIIIIKESILRNIAGVEIN